MDSFQSAYEMFKALDDKGPHEFRNGIVWCYIENFSYYENVFVINNIQAKCLDIDVDIDLPANFVNFLHDGDPLQSAYDAIANMIKFRAGY
jgi:hypothetical protein